MDNVQTVTAGSFFTLILKTDNSLWGTGLNSLGQLGDGTTSNKITPVKIMDNVLRMAGGTNHSVIYKLGANTASAVAYNFFGQLGNGTNTASPVWVNMLLPQQ